MFCIRYLLITFLLSIVSVFSQTTINYPLDIAGGLNDGSVEITIYPGITTGDTIKMFDQNQYTAGGIISGDSLAVTIHFNLAKKIDKCKVYLWNDGHWNLEAADTEDDLNNRTGTYQALVTGQNAGFFSWDSASFAAIQVSWLRFSAVNPQNSGVIIGEVELSQLINITELLILPVKPRMVPGTTLQLDVKLVADDGKVYPYIINDHVTWTSANLGKATIDEFGVVNAIDTGTVIITAATPDLNDTALVQILQDFQSTNADTLFIKVALVLQNPVIDSTNMRRIHQVWNWTNPTVYADLLLEEFTQMSDGVVKFQIVETIDDDHIWTKLDSNFMTIDTLAYYFMTPGMLYGRNTPGTLQNLAEVQGRVGFDYNAMVDFYDFDTKRNNGIINEIWVYSFPFGGMYESQLMGPNAFWWNSPPLIHPGLNKLLSVMGWNYERGIAEAIHSFGHRVESAIRHVYGRWNAFATDPNNWEIFTRIDRDLPGLAHVGNIHFPPNGQSDYDYANTTYVTSFADNWKRYPLLLDQSRPINRNEWGHVNGNYQLGFMRWWHNHLPRFMGVTDGILNNWWHYAVDYEGAKALANALGIQEENEIFKILPVDFSLKQNYPNPFNPVTIIRYELYRNSRVELKVYSILGQEVRTLVNEYQKTGSHFVSWDGKNNFGEQVASGMYFYRMRVGNLQSTKKLIFIQWLE